MRRRRPALTPECVPCDTYSAMEAAPEVGTFRVLLVDSGSASRVEVSALLASCRYQVRRPSLPQQSLTRQSCAPPWGCSQPPGRRAGVCWLHRRKCTGVCPAARSHPQRRLLQLVTFRRRIQLCDQACCDAIFWVSHDKGLPPWPIFSPADGRHCARLWKRSMEAQAVTTGSQHCTKSSQAPQWCGHGRPQVQHFV